MMIILCVYFLVCVVLAIGIANRDSEFESPFNTNAEKVEPQAIQEHKSVVQQQAGFSNTTFEELLYTQVSSITNFAVILGIVVAVLVSISHFYRRFE